jgi:hypothetical protein
MRSKLLIVATGLVALLASSQELSARWAFPTVLMIHGGDLKSPVFIVQKTEADIERYVSFWCGKSPRVEPAQLTDRPYYNVSAFWALSPLPDENGMAALLRTLKPEQAHQQGRLYVAADGIRASAVSTKYLELDPDNRTPPYSLVRPVPTNANSFVYGVWLSDADIEAAAKLGINLRR